MPDSGETIWTTIETSTLAALVKESVWAYPALETIHIIGLGLLFGAIVAFDLRVLGLNMALSVSRLGQHLLPWVWTGFGLNAMSGILLFVSDASDFAANPALRAKLFLILIAGLNAYFFRKRIAPRFGNWDQNVRSPAQARLSAASSIVLWIAIVVAGRMIAYVE
jgi:hypothetical protein